MWFPDAVWNALNNEQRDLLTEHVEQELSEERQSGWEDGYDARAEENCDECTDRELINREVALRTSVAGVWDELAAKRYTRGNNQGADRAWASSDHYLAREA